QALIDRINADLANDLGNAVHRSLAMLERYFEGVIPEPGLPEGVDRDVREVAERAVREVGRRIRAFELNEALAEVWRLVNRLNKYIDETEPWSLARHPSRRDRLATVMYHVFEGLRFVALLVGPFLPTAARQAWAQLGIGEPFEDQTIEAAQWGGLRPGTRTRRSGPLFPRIETDQEASAERGARQPAPLPTGAPHGPAHPAPPVKAADGKKERNAASSSELISIDEFGRIELRVARVRAAEPVSGADRLLKLQLDLGGEERQVVAGIAQHYTPEALIGKSVVVVANLRPARLRGERSEGMILAGVSDEGDLRLITVDGDLAPGSRVR
ncbi:MAG TPA: methionine--tRNA ligase subunit beta, partial [Limnochordia bacterium]